MAVALFVAGVISMTNGINIGNDVVSMNPSDIVGNTAPGIGAIPAGDKEAIAQHSHDGGHGYEVNLDNPTVEGIKDKIDEVLTNPDTQVGTRPGDGATGYIDPDQILVIHNPEHEDKGTAFYDENGETFYRDFR